LDARSLQYELYYEEGEREVVEYEDYTSENTERMDIEQTKALLRAARGLGFALRTTFIVGFPGETQEDFQALLDFVSEMRFDRVGAFTFSPEEDTKAVLMGGQVPEAVKKQRLDTLMALQMRISRELGQGRVGSVEKVLVTGKQDGRYTGRSAWEAPDADGLIYFDAHKTLKPGEFAQVRITSAGDYDLFGHLEAEA